MSLTIKHTCFFMLVLFLLSRFDGSLSAINLKDYQKNKLTYTVEWKTYSLPNDEQISLYGAKRRRFVTDQFYWGEAGYGALSGKRSGYLEGGVFAGYQDYFSPEFLYDARIFFGAGGGGSAPQGGGMIVHGTFGIGMPLQQDLHVTAEVGYIKFLNGEIESPTLGINLNYSFWEIERK
jgi:hypothetical protein